MISRAVFAIVRDFGRVVVCELHRGVFAPCAVRHADLATLDLVVSVPYSTLSRDKTLTLSVFPLTTLTKSGGQVEPSYRFTDSGLRLDLGKVTLLGHS